jgi:hypothetical protein
LVVALVGLFTARVGAQAAARASQPSAATASADYEAIVVQGLSEYQAHHYEEALALFTKAHEASPNARTLRGMALVEFELRRYVASLTHLQQALASQVKPLTGPLRAETEALLRRAQQYVARVMVNVEPANARARILVDGAPAAVPADGALLLQIGERVLEVQAEGFETERRNLVLQAGGDQALSVTLRPTHARVRIELTPRTPVAQLTVDGAAVMLPADGTLLLRVGERAVEARAEGFEPEERLLLVQGGQDQTLSIALRTLAAPSGALSAGPAPKRSVWKSPWLWTGVGALVVGGVVTALVATHKPAAKPYQSGDVGGVLQALTVER